MAFQPSESCRGTVDQRSRLRRGPQKMKMPAPVVDNCHESQALDRALCKRAAIPFRAKLRLGSRTQLVLSMAGAGAQRPASVMKAALQEPKLKHNLHAVVKISQDCHTDFG
jgi:hypothetical protein